MKRTIIFAATFALGASLAAANVVYAQSTTINEIDAHVELEDIENANALDFWPEIETDLARAIAAHAGDDRSDDGYDISVRLREISMSGSDILTGSGEFNHLEGVIYIREPDNSVPVIEKILVLDAETAAAGWGEHGIIIPGVPDFYVALVDTFAKRTVEEALALDPPEKPHYIDREDAS